MKINRTLNGYIRIYPICRTNCTFIEPKHNKMEKLCLDCNETLRGRSDKKFCDDQCRSNFNNRMKAGQQCCIRPVNSILRKNHSVLSKICIGEKIRIKKDVLLRNGFNPDYHTHLHQAQNGNTYFFCYDYGFLPLSNEEMLLVKRKEK